MTKIGCITSVLVVALLAVGALIYRYPLGQSNLNGSQNSIASSTSLKVIGSQRATVATSTMSNHKDMKLYRNEEFGFEFWYMPKYHINELKGGAYSEEKVPDEYLAGYRYQAPIGRVLTAELFRSNNKSSGIEISVYRAGGMGLMEWIDYVNKGVQDDFMYEGQRFNDVGSTTVAGQAGVVAGSGCCMTCVVNYLFQRDGYIYKISQEGYISPESKGPDICVKESDGFEDLKASFGFWRNDVRRVEIADDNNRYTQPIKKCLYDPPQSLGSSASGTTTRQNTSLDSAPKAMLGVWYYLFATRIPSGVQIKEIIKGSPAARVGLQKDDVILTIDGDRMVSAGVLSVLLSRHCPGDILTITVDRNGERRTFSVTLGQA